MRGIRHCDEIKVNIEHLSHLIMAASWLSRLDLAVRRRGEPTPPGVELGGSPGPSARRAGCDVRCRCSS
jgi:hypothetical protein